MQAMRPAAPTRRVTSWAKNALPPSAIRTRTGLIFFFGMSMLILATLGATFWINGLINADAARLLVLDHLIQGGQPLQPGLELLLHGGSAVGPQGAPLTLPPEGDPAILQQLQPSADDLPTTSADQVARLEQAARLIDQRRANNLGMTRGLYAALFISSTCFLLIGLWFTEELIARPLEELVEITSRIAGGDLDTPIVLSESHEFDALAQSFESMRLELRDSREHLAQWASELESRVAQRTQQLAALAHVATAASRSTGLEDVLQTALEQSLQAVGVETGGIWLVEGASGNLRLAVARGMSSFMQEQLRSLGRGEGLTGRAAQSGETIVLEDITQSSQPVKIIAAQEGLRSLVAVPVKMHEQVVGVLDVMTRQPRAFTAEELTLLTSIGQQIGIGVENARLIQEIRQQTERVAALQEREWIGAELHDGLLQTLSYLYLKADQAETQAMAANAPELVSQLAHQRQVLEGISGDIRRFITDLRQSPPPMSLKAALQKLVAEFTHNSPVQVELKLDGPIPKLEADRVAHLVRIASEALNNAAQHGNARRIVLTCIADDARGELRIQDDGKGFAPDAASQDGREHFGLSIMRARAVRIGGQLSVTSTPGQGTLVCITWPLAWLQGNM